MSEDVFSFPTRFRGYDREAVDLELQELRAALEYAHADRDRAVARALALEHGEPNGSQTSETVRWLIETAEQDARRIKAEAEQVAAENTERAEELLTHRVELVEQAQHEADLCRARAAEEARDIVHEALDKANALLRGLSESEAGIRELFASGVLAHRMPPPRKPQETPSGQAEATVGASVGAHVRAETLAGDQDVTRMQQLQRQHVQAQQQQAQRAQQVPSASPVPQSQAAQPQAPQPHAPQPHPSQSQVPPSQMAPSQMSSAPQTQVPQQGQQPHHEQATQAVAPHQATGDRLSH